MTAKTSVLLRLMMLGTLLAGVAQAENLNCDGSPIGAHDFQVQSGDSVQPKRLAMSRAFEGTGKLNVSICNADVRLLSRPAAKELEITVDVDADGGAPAREYVQKFAVQPKDGVVFLKFPASAHAKVTLTVPMKKGSELELNLGKGDLMFNAAGAAGERQINVGMGSVKLLTDDTTYASMQVNIGMGTLRDHRPGGQNGYFVVNKNFEARGDGSVQVNVGMGSMDIRQD